MEAFEKALEQLRTSLPSECFSTDREDLIQHGSSTWTYHNPEILPGVVVYPRSTEDVVKIAKAAYAHGIPVVPYSGGSKSCLQCNVLPVLKSRHFYQPV